MQKDFLALGQLPARHRSAAELNPDPLYSFVIPLFRTGRDGLRNLASSFQNLSIHAPWELVLVDDGSDDDTASLAREMRYELSGQVILVELAKNYGEHAAVLEGLRHASGRYIATLDDDLQTPPSEALRLLSELAASEAEIIYGKPEIKQHALWRNTGSAVVNFMATWLIGKPHHLYLSSFRVMRKELSMRLVKHSAPHLHLDALILQSSNRIEQQLVRHTPRLTGRSGYTVGKLLRLSMDLCMGYSTRPLRCLAALGILLSLLGTSCILLDCFTQSSRQFGSSPTIWWLAAVIGTQLGVMGLLGEYVGRLLAVTSGQPQSCIRMVTVLGEDSSR